MSIRTSLPLCSALIVLLAACGPSDDAEKESLAEEQAEARADSSVVADALEDTQENADDGTMTEEGDAAGGASSGIASKYTDTDPEGCKTLELETEEGSYVKQRCPGVGDVALIVTEGDGRMYVHAGNAPESGDTMGPFNTLGKTVEWRTKDGAPFAIIYRLKVATPDSADNDKTQLFVSKIGKGSAPSCLIAEIAGAYPDANAKARSVADANRGFRCGRDEKLTFGKIIQ